MMTESLDSMGPCNDNSYGELCTLGSRYESWLMNSHI